MKWLKDLYWLINMSALIFMIGVEHIFERKITKIIIITLLLLLFSLSVKGQARIGYSFNQVSQEFSKDVVLADRTPEDNILYLVIGADHSRNIYVFDDNNYCIITLVMPYDKYDVTWYNRLWASQGFYITGDVSGWVLPISSGGSLFVKEKKDDESGTYFQITEFTSP